MNQARHVTQRFRAQRLRTLPEADFTSIAEHIASAGALAPPLESVRTKLVQIEQFCATKLQELDGQLGSLGTAAGIATAQGLAEDFHRMHATRSRTLAHELTGLFAHADAAVSDAPKSAEQAAAAAALEALRTMAEGIDGTQLGALWPSLA